MAHRIEPGPDHLPVDVHVGSVETIKEQHLTPVGPDGLPRHGQRYRLSVRVDEGLAELYDRDRGLVGTRQPLPDRRALLEWSIAAVLADQARGRTRRARGYDVVARRCGGTGKEVPLRQGTVQARHGSSGALSRVMLEWDLYGLVRVDEDRIALSATAHKDARDHATLEVYLGRGDLPARAPDEPQRTVGIER